MQEGSIQNKLIISLLAAVFIGATAIFIWLVEKPSRQPLTGLTDPFHTSAEH